MEGQIRFTLQPLCRFNSNWTGEECCWRVYITYWVGNRGHSSPKPSPHHPSPPRWTGTASGNPTLKDEMFKRELFCFYFYRKLIGLLNFQDKHSAYLSWPRAVLCLGQFCPGYNVPTARSTHGAARGQHRNNCPQGKSKAAPCGMDLLY